MLDNLLSSFNHVTHLNPDFVGGIFHHSVGELGCLVDTRRNRLSLLTCSALSALKMISNECRK